MELLLRRFLLAYYFFSILVSYCFLYPFFYYYSRNPSRYTRLNFFRKIWAWFTSLSAGVFFKIHYSVPIDSKRTYVICANHSSFIDTNACIMVAKGPFHFMGKQELLKNPVLKLFFNTIDVPVDRASRLNSYKAFQKTSENLAKGMTLIIFPEAGIPNHYPPQVEEFKSGPFRLAIEHKLPILPITLPNNWKVIWNDGKRLGMKPGVCDVYVHEPIETADLKVGDEFELKEKIRNVIKATFDEQNYSGKTQ